MSLKRSEKALKNVIRNLVLIPEWGMKSFR